MNCFDKNLTKVKLDFKEIQIVEAALNVKVITIECFLSTRESH